MNLNCQSTCEVCVSIITVYLIQRMFHVKTQHHSKRSRTLRGTGPLPDPTVPAWSALLAGSPVGPWLFFALLCLRGPGAGTYTDQTDLGNLGRDRQALHLEAYNSHGQGGLSAIHSPTGRARDLHAVKIQQKKNKKIQKKRRGTDGVISGERWARPEGSSAGCDRRFWGRVSDTAYYGGQGSFAGRVSLRDGQGGSTNRAPLAATVETKRANSVNAGRAKPVAGFLPPYIGREKASLHAFFPVIRNGSIGRTLEPWEARKQLRFYA